MEITVAAQLVSGGGDAADKVRMMLCHPSQDEKRPGDIAAGQHFEHPVRLRFDARRQGCPMLMPGRTLHLSGVEVFLHIDTQNRSEIVRLASISGPRSVCGSTREGRDAQCSCPAAPCISVGWKYSSTSTLRTLRISFTFYARLRRYLGT